MELSKIKTILVDDEQVALDSLTHELTLNCPEVEIVGVAKTIEEAYQKINKHQPSLVFLDIDLGERSSFELLDLFNEISFQIIFVTGHNDFAIKAIKYSALDYILKPATGIDLIASVQRVKRNINKSESFNLLKEQIKEQKISNKIALQIGDKIVLINVSSILYCESDGNFTKVFLENEKLYISRNMKELEFLLQSQGFFRIHRSFLINLDQIQSYNQSEGGYIVMNNGKDIPISKRKKESFLKMLQLFGAR